MKKLIIILFLLISTTFFAQEKTPTTKQSIVHNITEFNQAVEKVKAGDVVTLANGAWKDAEFVLKGQGTEEKPITLKVENPGKVKIVGQSSLKLSGNYLVVNGLYFTNGSTPSNAVIQFRDDENHVASNSRITNCVIENFTQPSRDIKDHWVEFWGRNNQLDHCYIAGKSNTGPTIRVFLKGNENVYAHHQITKNYFGPRPRKGGPHGETIQIGSSETSMTPAYVNVEDNLFYRCNGEVEVISSKSNFNEFRHNIFFESEGSLVLRHGNYAKIDGNVFIGNDNSSNIGGIRVINTGHWITNNYFYKLKGSGFRAPLAVMNGIPKSPLNRYNQVTDVVAAYNTYVDCGTPWQLSVGSNVDKSDVLPSSEIRSARPERVLIANNLIYNQDEQPKPIIAFDTIDGVTFKNNLLYIPNKSDLEGSGIITEYFEMKKVSKYLYVPNKNFSDVYEGFDFETIDEDLFGHNRKKTNSVGAITLPLPEDANLFDKGEFGPKWFSAEKVERKPDIHVARNSEQLIEAINKATPGDIIELQPGNYRISSSLSIDKAITIRSKNKNNRARLEFVSNENISGFELKPQANLKIENISMSGNNKLNAFGTLEKNMSSAYNLWIKNSEISHFNKLLKVSMRSFADTISISGSRIKDLKSGIDLAEETDDKGEYNAEFVYMTNSDFENIQGTILNYYRGGYDESTIGGNLVFTANTVKNCGTSEGTEILVRTRGVVNVEMANNNFVNNPVKFIAILWGAKDQKPVNNTIKNSGEFKIEENLKQKLMY